MSSEFQFDVFLSHSAKDKAVVRELAMQLQRDGVRVWLDEEQIKPGDSIPSKIEEGLEQSRVLVFCMSVNTFESDWPQLEGHTFRFRDPLNKARCFIPLRLDNAPIKGSLAQLLYIKWQPANRDQQYAKLLAACRRPVDQLSTENLTEKSARPKTTTSNSMDLANVEKKIKDLESRILALEVQIKRARRPLVSSKINEAKTNRNKARLFKQLAALNAEWAELSKKAVTYTTSEYWGPDDDERSRIWDKINELESMLHAAQN